MRSFRFSVILFLSIVFIFLISLNIFAFDGNLLANLLKEEIRKSSINKEVNIGEIKFIGFSPNGNCIPEKLKIREIKRPNSVEFTFYCGTRQYRAIATYEILLALYISQRNLKRGEFISEEDILEIKKTSDKVPSGAVLNKNELIGKVVKRSISRGIILKQDHLYSGIPVKRGSHVQVLITSGKVTIMTDGVLKSDTTVGEMAKVQCFQTGKEIVGELIDKDKVRIVL